MKNLFQTLFGYGEYFIEALFPSKCVVCGKPGEFVCIKHRKFPIAPPNKAKFNYLDKIYVVTAYYDKNVQKIIENFKFEGNKKLGRFLAEEMSTKMKNVEKKNLVPVPLHWTRKFWRGFNQSEILAQEMAKQDLGVKIFHELKRKKRTVQQATLSKTQRKENMKNAFEWESKSVPDEVIIIDDVVASGSTLDSVAKALKEAGTKKVIAIVFARGGRTY